MEREAKSGKWYERKEQERRKRTEKQVERKKTESGQLNGGRTKAERD